MRRDTTYTHKGVTLARRRDEVVPDLLRRLILVLLLIAFITGILWLDREGLEDSKHPGQPISALDVFYFAVVTLTTVGYGDIVPVAPQSRLIAAIIITPVRVIILIIFIGTAYQLAYQRYQEAYQMRKVRECLKDHIIICGYGVKGHATVAQLISYGRSKDEIVIIDCETDVTEDAASEGLIAFRGDATSEATLKAAEIGRASHVIVDVDRDDTTVLACLTAKHLNPNICVVAAAREAENIPLIYRSGADVVVAPPVAGGRILAIATQLSYAPRFLEDIMTFGKGLDFGEKKVQPAEAGLTVNELPELAGKLPIGVYHREQSYPYDQLTDLRLNAGDVIIYLVSKDRE